MNNAGSLFGIPWPMYFPQPQNHERPHIRINPAFACWKKHEAMPHKYECASVGARATGNTREQAYSNWLDVRSVQERARRQKALADYCKAMQNAQWNSDPFGYFQRNR